MRYHFRFENVQLPSGVRLHYARQGRPGAPAVLMLHGLTDSWFSFSRVLPLLPFDLDVIVPDQRGHGASGKLDEGYGSNDFAKDALELMTTLGIDRATVVGHSMGSFVAQRMAILARERVARVVLVSSATIVRNKVTLALADAVRTLADPVPVGFVREFQLSTVYRELPAAFLDRVVAESLKVPARLWRHLVPRMLQADWISDLSLIRCPTLALWGDRDSIFPMSEQDALVMDIHDVKLKVLSDVGHSPHWEVPSVFVSELLEFAGYSNPAKAA